MSSRRTGAARGGEVIPWAAASWRTCAAISGVTANATGAAGSALGAVVSSLQPTSHSAAALASAAETVRRLTWNPLTDARTAFQRRHAGARSRDVAQPFCCERVARRAEWREAKVEGASLVPGACAA